MSQPTWTPERIAILERLWTDGLSASEIAARFPGVTRNAVLGKLHRLGRLRRGRPVAPAKVRKAKSPPRPKAPRRTCPATTTNRPPPLGMPTWAGEVVAVEALRSWHCRWPIGDPHDFGFAFCGRRVSARPYCEDHRAVAYEPASPAPRGGAVTGRTLRMGQA
jgi:GcrA cell cycle regulator